MKKTIITIDMDAIEYNYKLLRKITNQGELCIPIIKGNGYGFNYFDMVNRYLNMNDPQKDFFVYSIVEGAELRQQFNDKINNIYCVTGPMKNQENIYYKYKITPVINSIEQLHLWSNFAKQKNEKLKIILQFNLGLNRSGLQQSEVEYVKNFIVDKNNNLELIMVMGHLANQHRLDSELGQKLTKREFELFENAYKHFPGIKRGLLGTEGILKIKEGLFEFSRPGTVLVTGQPEFETNYIFKTAITIVSPVYLTEDKNLIYINFGINQGISSYYEKNGFILVNGEKIYAKKVELNRIYFSVENNKKYENKEALLIGYKENDYIDGYTFSRMNGSVPEEVLSKVAMLEPSDMVEHVVLGKYNEKIKELNDVEYHNKAKFKDGKLKKFTSIITEIRTIEEDGGCGYDGKESVKTGDIIATFPVGYSDGLDRKLSCKGASIHMIVDGKIEAFKFCGGVPMDQMCFKIPKEYFDKIHIGDTVIIVDDELGIGTDSFCKLTDLSEEELFFMVSRSRRVKKIY